MQNTLKAKNFTEIGVEAIKQDFFSTLYRSGLKSLLSESAQHQINEEQTERPQKVNRAVP